MPVEPLRPELGQLLARYGFPPNALLLVPSVQAWAQSNGLTENNPFRQATAFPAVGLIVMRSTLSENFMGESSTYLHLGLEKYLWITETSRRFETFRTF